MTRKQSVLLVSLHLFLGITAVAGGVALMAGFQTPPLALLDSSPFRTFFVPGLALAVLVGGPAIVTAGMLLRRNPHAILPSYATAIAVLVFEGVEIAVVGSPAGPARAMQVLYVAIGISIGVASLLCRKPPIGRLADGRADAPAQPTRLSGGTAD